MTVWVNGSTTLKGMILSPATMGTSLVRNRSSDSSQVAPMEYGPGWTRMPLSSTAGCAWAAAEWVDLPVMTETLPLSGARERDPATGLATAGEY